MDPTNKGVRHKDSNLYVPYEGPRGGEGVMNVSTGRVQYDKTMQDVGGVDPMQDPEAATQALEGASPSEAENYLEAYVSRHDKPAELVEQVAKELGTDVRDPGVPQAFAENPGALAAAESRLNSEKKAAMVEDGMEPKYER